jgi:hypothetical protein
VVGPFPWSALPRVDRRAGHLARAATAWLRGRRALGAGHVVERRGGAVRVGPSATTALGLGEVRLGGTALLGGAALAARLADPTAAAAAIRGDGLRGFVVAPGALVRAVAQAVLDGPDELPAPRPPTVTERAVLVVAVAAILDELEVAVEVEPCDLSGPEVAAALGEAALVEVAVAAPRATVAVVLPPAAVLAPPRVPLPVLIAEGPGGRDAVPVHLAVVLARARLAPAALANLRVRDVLVARRPAAPPGPPAGAGPAPRPVELALGRGGLLGALALSAGRVTVRSSYCRADPMDETLGDDATVDVAVAVGDLRLSVRELLELAPGQVLALGHPVGSAVELRVGPRVIARGELVDVDGEVGVRVTSLEAAGGPP